jgi:hypothetical protein
VHPLRSHRKILQRKNENRKKKYQAAATGRVDFPALLLGGDDFVWLGTY